MKYLVTYRSAATNTQVVKTITADEIDLDDTFATFFVGESDQHSAFIVASSLLESVELLPADVPASEQAAPAASA